MAIKPKYPPIYVNTIQAKPPLTETKKAYIKGTNTPVECDVMHAPYGGMAICHMIVGPGPLGPLDYIIKMTESGAFQDGHIEVMLTLPFQNTRYRFRVNSLKEFLAEGPTATEMGKLLYED